MTIQFKRLFTPGKIGKVEIRNRIATSAACVCYASQEGEITQRNIDYMEARAKGGTGLLFVEAAYPERDLRGLFCEVGIYDDKLIPGLKRLTEAVHRHGAKIGIQISHAGREYDITSPSWRGSPLESSSPIPSLVVPDKTPPLEMTNKRIEEMAESFGEAARRAKEANFDLVEIHGGHGYVIASFLSPYFNKRTDEYGGSLENRVRFPLQILKAIRAKVGEDFPVGMKISGDEYTEGGLTLEDQKEFASEFEKAGFDYIQVSAGIYTIPAMAFIVPPMEIPLGCNEHLSAGIKEVVSIPVILVGRINDPVLAEQILERGSADFCAMVRAHLSDPEIANKAKEGRLDEIVPCVACNQGCIARMYGNLDITCTTNPALGRERGYEIKPAAQKKKVLVIGGGPAGMECARVAALRGHEVILYEKEAELGGQNRYAKIPPTREEFGDVGRYLSRQVEKLGVDIRLNQEATLDTVKKMINPEVVVVATGARPFIPSIPGIMAKDGGLAKNVVTPIDVLAERIKVGERVVVIGANTIGLETAEYLVDQGKKVTVVEKASEPVCDMHDVNSWFALTLPRIKEKGIEIKTLRFTKEITPDEVVLDMVGTISPSLTEGPVDKIREERIGVDTVVLAVGREPVKELFELLKGEVSELYAIGDCVEPRVTFRATGDGARIGRQI